jgi:hypothetical protein
VEVVRKQAFILSLFAGQRSASQNRARKFRGEGVKTSQRKEDHPPNMVAALFNNRRGKEMSQFDIKTFGRAFAGYAAILAIACGAAAWIREENKPVNDPPEVVASALERAVELG